MKNFLFPKCIWIFVFLLSPVGASALMTIHRTEQILKVPTRIYDFFEQERRLQVDGLLGSASIVVGSFEPRPGVDLANLIYLPGFGDTIDNHQVLFEKFRQAGVRVIGFDYPGHGESTGQIWTWTLKSVALLMKQILEMPDLKIDRSLPLLLAGWSTGATIALRTLERSHFRTSSWADEIFPQTEIAGLILFAPVLPAPWTVGDRWIFPENRTLTRSLGLIRNPPKPTSTIAAGRFTGSLKLQSEIASSVLVDLPKNLPILIVMGGRHERELGSVGDLYADTLKTENFVQHHLEQGASIFAFECPTAYHGVEFEPDGIGSTAVSLASHFARGVINTKRSEGKSLREFFSDRFTTIACPRFQPAH